ncbi:Uncharacterised protein [Mycobacteroides abscessus subsp. abscessus]|nr:Uncharacterised protein [Mycobacteroides abscessus subsp. abscessus]
MHQTDTPVLLMGVLPVGDPCRGCPDVRGDPHAQRVGGQPVRARGAPTSDRFADRQSIKSHRCGQHPGSQRCQRRMHRMTQPYPVKSVGYPVTGTTKSVVTKAQNVFQPVTRPVQPLLTPDRCQY